MVVTENLEIFLLSALAISNESPSIMTAEKSTTTFTEILLLPNFVVFI